MASSDGGLSSATLAERVAAAGRIAEKSRRVAELWLSNGGAKGAGTLPVGSGLANDFVALSQQLLANPTTLVETQAEFWQDYLTLWQRTAQRMLGLEAEPVIAPGKDDRRFKHEQWSENAAFDFIKQSYLLSARCLHNTVRGADGLDDQTRRKVESTRARWSTRWHPATSRIPIRRWWPPRWRAAAAIWSRGWRICWTISSAARASSRSA